MTATWRACCSTITAGVSRAANGRASPTISSASHRSATRWCRTSASMACCARCGFRGASRPPSPCRWLATRCSAFACDMSWARGAFATVYLAEQVELAGRPVVVKVSSDEGAEPQTLAQLQHTHIVPIYSQHVNAAAGLRGVHAVLRRREPVARPRAPSGSRRRSRRRGDSSSGRCGWCKRLRSTTSNACRTEVLVTSKIQRPAQTPLARLEHGSYIEASAWIVACLADGLHHAHQRGILHRDIKPSNILLAADGQPLLLDFNLSEDIKEPHRCHAATLGGTVAYMAPEHLRDGIARSGAGPQGRLPLGHLLARHGALRNARRPQAVRSERQLRADAGADRGDGGGTRHGNTLGQGAAGRRAVGAGERRTQMPAPRSRAALPDGRVRLPRTCVH